MIREGGEFGELKKKKIENSNRRPYCRCLFGGKNRKSGVYWYVLLRYFFFFLFFLANFPFFLTGIADGDLWGDKARDGARHSLLHVKKKLSKAKITSIEVAISEIEKASLVCSLIQIKRERD